MGEALKNTNWPSIAISVEAQNLIGQFFTLMDDKSESVGTKLTKEVFTENGTMIAAAGAFTGSTGKHNYQQTAISFANVSQQSRNQESTLGMYSRAASTKYFECMHANLEVSTCLLLGNSWPAETMIERPRWSLLLES